MSSSGRRSSSLVFTSPPVNSDAGGVWCGRATVPVGKSDPSKQF